MGTSVVNAGLGYVYWTVAARHMSAVSVGLGSAMISAMVILSLAVYLGPGGGLIARLPKRATRADWVATALSAQLGCVAATAILAAAALYPLAQLLPALRPLATDPRAAAWFVLGAAGWTCSGLLDYIFIAERRSSLMLRRNASASVVKVASLFAVLAFGRHTGATAILATWSLSGLTGSVSGLVLCHRRIHRLGPIPWRVLRREFAELARPSLGHHAISIGGLLPTYLLPVVVTARLGAQQNAYFYVTWMVGSSIFMISPAVSSAIFAEGSHDAGRLRNLSGSSLRIILAVVVPAVLVVGLAGRLILSLFGHGYAVLGYPLLLILLASSFPDAVTNISVATLRVRGKLAAAAVLNGSMAVLSVAGAWILAAHLSIRGAGAAWLIAQSAGALAVFVLHKRLWPPPDRETAAPSARLDAREHN